VDAYHMLHREKDTLNKASNAAWRFFSRCNYRNEFKRVLFFSLTSVRVPEPENRETRSRPHEKQVRSVKTTTSTSSNGLELP